MRSGERQSLVLRFLAGAVVKSTAEVAEECFTDAHAGNPRSQKALRTLRQLERAGKVETAGQRNRYGDGGPVLVWRLTDAGRAGLASRE
jgi:hypothetical protein